MATILQTSVEALFPVEGSIHVMLYGEAPGPLGADKSGIPFWGDRSGVNVYRALQESGMALVPPAAFEDWGGERFQRLGLRPNLMGAALSNAYPVCPTRDGMRFRAPSDAELKQAANLARIRQELSKAAARCPGRLRIITMGRRAAWIFQRMDGVPEFELQTLPHPSAQGLLQAAPGKGKGLRLADLQAEWEEKLRKLLTV